MALTKRRPLTRQRVADAALALIDEGGLEELSMRKLGSVLGVEAMSLYNHIDNKADLLTAVTNTLYAEVLEACGDPKGDDWKVHARSLSHAFVDVAGRHPNAVRLLIDTPVDCVEELEFHTRIMAVCKLMTDDIRTAALAFSVVGNWIVGTIVQEHGLMTPATDATSGDAEMSDGFDEVVRFRAESGHLTSGERFAEGLETVLAGVETRYFPA